MAALDAALGELEAAVTLRWPLHSERHLDAFASRALRGSHTGPELTAAVVHSAHGGACVCVLLVVIVQVWSRRRGRYGG